MSCLCLPSPYLTATHIAVENPTAQIHAAKIHQSSCRIDRTRRALVKNRAATKIVASTVTTIVTADVAGPLSGTIEAFEDKLCLWNGLLVVRLGISHKLVGSDASYSVGL